MKILIAYLCSSDPHSSFLAARYLSSFDLHVRTGEARSISRNIADWLCRHYLDEAVKMPSIIEWLNFGKLLSTESMLESHVGAEVAKLAPYLLRQVRYAK